MNEVRDGKNILANDLQGSNRPPTTEEENDICVMNTSELICQVVSEAEIFLSASDSIRLTMPVYYRSVNGFRQLFSLSGLEIIFIYDVAYRVYGCLFLNATSGTYYLDNETLASETFLAGLGESRVNSSTCAT
ncbi:BnaC01g43400D [Brassica napus]|uniref:BnaC01g43400D protein n=1 Tax=Brassica napus TaxID=3708 RepID=A0A078IFQ1_BRANA|nr:BnaC01g43400D [Brassica napus]